jgi:hypothetical protein
VNRILQNYGFRIHLITYVAVNALLLAINLVTSPDKLWFYWPLLGWGIGILGHAYAVHRKAGMPEVTKSAVADVHPTSSPTAAATVATAPAARTGPTQILRPDVKATVAPGTIIEARATEQPKSPPKPADEYCGLRADVRATIPPASLNGTNGGSHLPAV